MAAAARSFRSARSASSRFAVHRKWWRCPSSSSVTASWSPSDSKVATIAACSRSSWPLSSASRAVCDRPAAAALFTVALSIWTVLLILVTDTPSSSSPVTAFTRWPAVRSMRRSLATTCCDRRAISRAFAVPVTLRISTGTVSTPASILASALCWPSMTTTLSPSRTAVIACSTPCSVMLATRARKSGLSVSTSSRTFGPTSSVAGARRANSSSATAPATGAVSVAGASVAVVVFSVVVLMWVSLPGRFRIGDTGQVRAVRCFLVVGRGQFGCCSAACSPSCRAAVISCSLAPLSRAVQAQYEARSCRSSIRSWS